MHGLTRMCIGRARRKYVTQEKPISRFPVPKMDTLPEDIQARMKEVEEKVTEQQPGSL